MNDSWQERSTTRNAGGWPFDCCSRRGGLAVAAVLAATGIAFALGSLMLSFGDLSLPGPGFFPFVLGLVLVGLGAAIFIAGLQEPRDAPRITLGHPPVLIAFTAMIAAAALFERLGALLTLGA